MKKHVCKKLLMIVFTDIYVPVEEFQCLFSIDRSLATKMHAFGRIITIEMQIVVRTAVPGIRRYKCQGEQRETVDDTYDQRVKPHNHGCDLQAVQWLNDYSEQGEERRKRRYEKYTRLNHSIRSWRSEGTGKNKRG